MSDLTPRAGGGRKEEEREKPPPEGDSPERNTSDEILSMRVGSLPEALIKERLGRLDTRKALFDLCRNVSGLEDVLLPRSMQADALTRRSNNALVIREVTKRVMQDQAAWDAFRTAIEVQVPAELREAAGALTQDNLDESVQQHTPEGLLLAAALNEEPPPEEVVRELVERYADKSVKEADRATKDARVRELESELELTRRENERLSFQQRAAAERARALAEEVESLTEQLRGHNSRSREAEERVSTILQERSSLEGRLSGLEHRGEQLERALEGERKAYSRAAERVDELHGELDSVTKERDKIRNALQNARFTDRGFGDLVVRAVKNEVSAMPASIEHAAQTAKLLEFMGRVLQTHEDLRNGRSPESRGGSRTDDEAEDPESSQGSRQKPPVERKVATVEGTGALEVREKAAAISVRPRPSLSFRALGGAGEVGGSSHLLDFEKSRILIDAGIKPDGRGPAAPMFASAEKLDAAVITHAHLDHCGALPVLVRDRPNLPIYCTPPSARLIVNALNDHAAMGGSIPGGVPIHEVKKRLIPMEFGKDFSIGDTKIRLTESGHLLGAASVLLTNGSARVFHTGDISLEDHFSIPSAKLPDVHDIDLLIMEATLADQQAQPFADSVRTMIEVINDTTLLKEGSVLIPTYALGQAQEIILALKHFSKELEDDVFIYVDGSVVTTSERLYAEQLGYMKPYLQQSNPREVFFSENIRAVANDDSARERILTSPCAIIASPVTMQGGASAFYRKRLENDPKNAVILPSNASSAYMPLPSGEEGWRVEKVNFAAHCTQGDLLSITKRLSPRQIILIHGSRRRISDLAFKLAPQHKIHTPTVGETVRTVL
ncbi:MBL fold metallo-hydrolase [Rubrobacter indicoceani]|uniref:MBL fold metallo-hydrolase n=1 Tax=Rubrobacter indicoceani TaxID=2051957 RepID=UPI000E5B2913|nr:MBL fold metallo-hydrolase [Rubrobacter indicoceani]